ncbi:hypothetical protein BP5796_04045 [Coleophoma crateriformis]|uniref:tRNA wybutosine-synthesizing protein 4 n=1 Tax=Coleophoma crateriformis TaxID=565419 RepID=A0A3D8SHC0_9HELO|nr:hypothetical protein BP5796_04045 [Coleophoma crateriformis]
MLVQDQSEVDRPSEAKVKGSSKPKIKAKAQLHDDSVMGTNNSSIVSKRSVERIYFPDEPHFFRYFVKKPQRRAPLINRGYWLRMKAIDHVVYQFLKLKSKKPKVVINLGCGYDPLPWQTISRYPEVCQDVKFIDIDYKDLMLKKRDVVMKTLELKSMFSNLEAGNSGDVLLRSDQYLQLGCDLRDLPRLDQALRSVVDTDACQILFVSEVAITYMPSEAVDALIKWTSALPQAQFCLLEQLLPNGIEHPFAQTMMAHFNKLTTPLGSVEKYPTVAHQEQRFRSLGWSKASARNLWDLWGAPEFMDSSERQKLDEVEPFDEWEEFALFGTHYYVLVAKTENLEGSGLTPGLEHEMRQESSSSTESLLEIEITYNVYPTSQGYRRFAAPFECKSSNNKQSCIGNFAGMGLNTRVSGYDVYTTCDQKISESSVGHQKIPSSRMCHTLTELGDTGALLIGGRTSPDNALPDCWLYHKYLDIWERVEDLPQPRYRHSAVCIGPGLILVTGGRSNSINILADQLVWSRASGWVPCTIVSPTIPPATYGSTLICFQSSDPVEATGCLAGGIAADGLVQKQVWTWKVEKASNSKYNIFFDLQIGAELPIQKLSTSLARFGASVVPHNDQIYIVGGIIKNDLLADDHQVCRLNRDFTCSFVKLSFGADCPKPLLVGVSAMSCDNSILIMGGSAVCFSFGTFWNKGCYTLSLPNEVQKMSTEDASSRRLAWQYSNTIDAAMPAKQAHEPPTIDQPHNLVTIPRRKLNSVVDFQNVLSAGKPVVFEGLDIGPCKEKWTSDYLKDQVGPDRMVVVHQASTEHMDFKTKNFAYVSKSFGDFIDNIESGEKLYLRSLSAEKPSELPANIENDFPTLAKDFRLPPELEFVAKNAHSSPLRLSGPVIMWLHYDVMANVLCQVRGSKRLLLFPPSDVRYFDFEPGASSSSINVFDNLGGPKTARTHPHEVLMNPGDVLFLPPLWLHTTSPASGVSIAVNVFFRNLQSGYAAGKDVYGNRDLQVYEKGRQDITKIIKSFDGCSPDVREFYLQRLADEFQQKSS